MMASLLRADAYRTLRSRWLWAVAALMALVILAPALLMRATDMGPDSFDTLTGSALSLGGVEILSSVMAAVACCDRDSLGFDRTVLSALGGRARRTWYAERCVFAVLLATAALAYAFVLGLVAVPVSGVPVTRVEAAPDVALWFGCVWLCCAVYAALTTVVGLLTRNQTVTMGFALLGSVGILEGGLAVGIDAACVLAGGTFPGLGSALAPWLPAGILSVVGAGAGGAGSDAAGLLSAANATGVAPAVRALIVCAPLLAASIAVSALALSRRDVS